MYVDIFMVSSFFDKQFVVDINVRDFLQICCGLVYIIYYVFSYYIMLLYNTILYHTILYYNYMYYIIIL